MYESPRRRNEKHGQLAIHGFEESKRRGDYAAHLIAEHIQDTLGLNLRPTFDGSDQRRGIDYRALHVTYEVKNDFKATRTGNAYMEHLSDKDRNVQGWVRYCDADWLLYNVPEVNLFWLRPPTVKRMHYYWIERFPCRPAHNRCPKTGREWSSEGTLVPLSELRRLSSMVWPAVTIEP